MSRIAAPTLAPPKLTRGQARFLNFFLVVRLIVDFLRHGGISLEAGKADMVRAVHHKALR
jgi:hypothetical protein